jgi:hypothetical protein
LCNFFLYFIQHCCICRPSDSTVPRDARDRTQDCCVVSNDSQTGLSADASMPEPLVQFGIKIFCWYDPDQAFFGATKWGKKCHGSGTLVSVRYPDRKTDLQFRKICCLPNRNNKRIQELPNCWTTMEISLWGFSEKKIESFMDQSPSHAETFTDQ